MMLRDWPAQSIGSVLRRIAGSGRSASRFPLRGQSSEALRIELRSKPPLTLADIEDADLVRIVLY
ncbi:hypothetical protein [Cupriavidus alkaliphilus]|uniref:hypothetical protein n=1 Tax=Cupriavidus alkaliphilus TaxID=942866 RepID=UPI00339D6F64